MVSILLQMSIKSDCNQACIYLFIMTALLGTYSNSSTEKGDVFLEFWY